MELNPPWDQLHSPSHSVLCIYPVVLSLFIYLFISTPNISCLGSTSCSSFSFSSHTNWMYSFTLGVEISKRSELTQPIALISIYPENLVPGPAQVQRWDHSDTHLVRPGGREELPDREHGCPDSKHCGQGSFPQITEWHERERLPLLIQRDVLYTYRQASLRTIIIRTNFPQ